MFEDHKWTYVKNAVWLAALTVLELGVVYTKLPKAGQILLLFSFAATKMMLVALFYMHLRYETKTLRIIVCLPIPIGVLFTLALMYDLPFRWI